MTGTNEEEFITNFTTNYALELMKELEKRGYKEELHNCTRYYAQKTKWVKDLTFDEARAICEYCEKVLHDKANVPEVKNEMQGLQQES